MGIYDDAEGWLFNVALRKAVTIGVKGILAFLTGAVGQHYLTQLGVSYDPTKLQEGLTVISLGGFEALHDYLKLKEIVKF